MLDDNNAKAFINAVNVARIDELDTMKYFIETEIRKRTKKAFKKNIVDPYIPPTKENLTLIKERVKMQEDFAKEFIKK